MTSLIKSIVVIVAVFITSNAASAQWYASNANPASVGSISVTLEDGAEDACWTNLREAREYAEEKLKINGYNVIADEGGKYGFYIYVNAFRTSSGSCVGDYGVQIYTPNELNGVFGFHEIGANSGVGIHSDNLNRYIISMISDMFEKM